MRPWSSSLGRQHDSDANQDDFGLPPQNDGDSGAPTSERSAVSPPAAEAPAAGAPARSCYFNKDTGGSDDYDDDDDDDDSGSLDRNPCSNTAASCVPGSDNDDDNNNSKKSLVSGALGSIALLSEDEQGHTFPSPSEANFTSYLMSLVTQDLLSPSLNEDAEMSDSEGGAPLNIFANALGSDATSDPHYIHQNQAWHANHHSSQLPNIGYEMQHNTFHDTTSAMDVDDGSTSDSQSEVDDADAPGEVAFPLWLHEAAVLDNGFDVFGPLQQSNPNPSILGSENYGLVAFLREWAQEGYTRASARFGAPHILDVRRQADAMVEDVTYEDLMGDECDFQRLNWSSMQTTRDAARRRRRERYLNYVNRPGSDRIINLHDRAVMSRDSFFRFKRMHFRRDISLAHFQLRSVLACPTRTEAYFSSPGGISRTNLSSRTTVLNLNLRDLPATSTIISTLDAGHGVLMGGTFNGDYCLKSLDSENNKEFWEGQIAPDAITNHLRIHTPRRSHKPVASIASNDHGFRVLDIETQKFVMQKTYQFALNCSALSADGRLRVVVGDDSNVLIINADNGEVMHQLTGHFDYGFACDWSEDGWTVATGFQDKSIKIWDARKWCTTSGRSSPLCSLRCDMAGARSLRFSPLGSGRRVLVAAEEADIVNVIDAQGFCSKQTIDVFSEIGGVAFTNEGQDLNILCCDGHRGGLLQLERCGAESHLFDCKWPLHSEDGTGSSYPEQRDWPHMRKPVSVEDCWTF